MITWKLRIFYWVLSDGPSWAEMLCLSTGGNLPLPTGPSWTLSCMVRFWHWHIPTMVGFCHGGNMPASHRHHHHHPPSPHHHWLCSSWPRSMQLSIQMPALLGNCASSVITPSLSPPKGFCLAPYDLCTRQKNIFTHRFVHTWHSRSSTLSEFGDF